MKQQEKKGKAGTLRSRLLWFVFLWCGGVLTITIVGYGLKRLFFSV